MTIQAFIEKAKAGGCIGYDDTALRWSGISVHQPQDTPFSIFLSPSAWKAVGKVEGWKRYAMIEWYDELGTKKAREAVRGVESWRYQMHRMIDALAEGKTIEQHLETL